MKDRIPAPGKEGRVKLTLDDGQAIEGVLEMADDAIEEGTPYGKATCLTDATAAALGLEGENPTINDAFTSMIPNINKYGVPAGAIVMWSGAVNAVPSGWALCDGTNNTPDLRGRFIVGAGATYAVGDTGGAETVTLTVDQMPSHSHSITTYDEGSTVYDRVNGRTQAKLTYKKPTTSDTGGDQPHENRPPYYALCYIIKL